jgi:uncharacterized membrane protein YciS (DUF1049 family)
MRLILQCSLFLFLLIGGIIVGTQNAVLVDVNFFGRTFPQKPMWMLLLIAFAIGAATSLLFCLFEILRLWGRLYGMKRQVKILRQQQHLPPIDDPIGVDGEAEPSLP